MDGPDPSTVEQLIEAIMGGNVAAIVGVALLLLAPAVTYVTRGKVSDGAEKVVSMVRGLAVGFGAALVTAAASGGEWWIGVVTGAAGLLASAGFLDQVRALLPDRR